MWPISPQLFLDSPFHDAINYENFNLTDILWAKEWINVRNLLNKLNEIYSNDAY